MSDRMISGCRNAYYAIADKWNLSRSRVDSVPPGEYVDIIIPTYNRSQILVERALPSISAQTYKKFRVIVVDHGSVDDTELAVYRYKREKDRRVRYFRCERHALYPPTAKNHWLAGPVEPLNYGLSKVTGKWIARIDDDDEWHEDHLINMIGFAEANNYEFVSSLHYTTSFVSTKWRFEVAQPYCMPDGTCIGGTQTWVYRSYLKCFRYNPHCWRKAWNANNDTDLQHRMWKAGVRMGYYPHPTCTIRPRPGTDKIGLAAYMENAQDIERFYTFR